MNVMKDQGIIYENLCPKVRCKAFEDNSGAFELARIHKLRPRTKHINTKFHHFRQYVREGHIKVEQVDTENQLADLFTKPLSEPLFKKFTEKIMGWSREAELERITDERGSVNMK